MDQHQKQALYNITNHIDGQITELAQALLEYGAYPRIGTGKLTDALDELVAEIEEDCCTETRPQVNGTSGQRQRRRSRQAGVLRFAREARPSVASDT